MKRLLCCVVALPLLLAADKDKDDAKKDLANLEGTWTVVKVEYDGKSLEERTKDLRFVFKGDTMTVSGSEEIEKGYGKITLKLDPSTTPKILDLTVSAGSEKGSIMEGIYELKGDEFRMCVKVMEKGRPAKFEALEGDGACLVVLKREKK
jgi:uncharacterized protein (TIGR03067 family)